MHPKKNKVINYINGVKQYSVRATEYGVLGVVHGKFYYDKKSRRIYREIETSLDSLKELLK